MVTISYSCRVLGAFSSALFCVVGRPCWCHIEWRANDHFCRRAKSVSERRHTPSRSCYVNLDSCTNFHNNGEGFLLTADDGILLLSCDSGTILSRAIWSQPYWKTYPIQFFPNQHNPLSPDREIVRCMRFWNVAITTAISRTISRPPLDKAEIVAYNY